MSPLGTGTFSKTRGLDFELSSCRLSASLDFCVRRYRTLCSDFEEALLAIDFGIERGSEIPCSFSRDAGPFDSLLLSACPLLEIAFC